MPTRPRGASLDHGRWGRPLVVADAAGQEPVANVRSGERLDADAELAKLG